MDTASLALLGDQWRRAAQELGIKCQIPYTLVAIDGATFEFACLLPQFGAARGMLIGATYNKAAADAALSAGFAFSHFDAEPQYVPFEIAGYVDCLKDWGWAVPREQPPAWFTSGG